MPTEQCCWTSLLEAARAFHNITIADPEVKLSCPTTTKRDAVVAAGECLRAAIAALAQQRVPDAVRELPGKWRLKAKSARAYGHVEEALAREFSADELESALATIDSQQEARK